MRQAPIIGCIADDFTGASDIASFFVKGGMSATQVNGLPNKNDDVPQSQALVVALKIRTESKQVAITQALDALLWLQAAGCKVFYYKYCSTFDSTAQGNIGPVIDALLEALALPQALVCPALPANGRTVYQGHLFVFDQLLQDSPLKDHPLTPMRDSNLTRLLAPQVAPEHSNSISVLPLANIAVAQLTQEHKQSRYLITDCVTKDDLQRIAQLMSTQPAFLFTGGSGLAEYMPTYLGGANIGFTARSENSFNTMSGKTLMIAGSCSAATRAQVSVAQETMPSYQVDPSKLMQNDAMADEILTWISEQVSDAVLVYSSADPDTVKSTQQELGTQTIATKIEALLSDISVRSGIKNIVVAGGETSGAVVEALGLSTFNVGPSVCPGVPLVQSHGANPTTLALKSGNFGTPQFFGEANSLILSLNAQGKL
jgi:uncharacterized protein YgbK (DUF1537 family)